MSGLAKEFAKTKLSALPLPPPEPSPRSSEEGDGAVYDDSSSSSSLSSTGTVVPTSSLKPAPAPPVGWSDFFEQELYLDYQTDSLRAQYHVYLTPPSAPDAPLFVCHHGAASSALSFATFALELRKLLPTAGVLSLEARDHGSVVASASSNNAIHDFSLPALTQDALAMIRLTQAKLAWSSLPPLVLVGHSLGGAVLTSVAASFQLGPSVLGYAVLDIVEGSAMDALTSMSALLRSRPSTFPTLQAGIDWHLRSRTLRNPASARASVPSLLIELPSGEWTWRTDLAATQPFWAGWFEGLSRKFLEARGAKLLLLAGTDRLDKELMIGQMQGKFQMHVFPTAGHFIHEDLPAKTAAAVAEFFKRNDRSTLVLPPKVSELLAQGKKV
ncbi:Protein phosphatase methylesterase 1 [Cryomyces antarcticus]|nr:Protein phosphatase methylesterase 1 [Cryomyces antarcticus]